ncbi:ribonuclease HI family protein [uncultured Methanofollis sp.]|uniref:ribonuclease HI family protein n=1 Tax=uncultured Methanofollis sp. TaxID=262500 RepID=UPI00260291C3|nr:ribonuclease HI family protein [uncultured Methanofollis sp.]
MSDEGGFDIYTDGASRGNPGHAAYAYLFVEGGAVVLEDSGYAGVTTNNTAEYLAITHALEAAAGRTAGDLSVYSDSELVVRQMNGEYRVNKEHLRELKAGVLALVGRFRSVRFVSVRRTNPHIAQADRLCNEELDRRGA